MKLANVIDHPQFLNPPTALKIAFDGEWERAKIVRVGKFIDREQIVEFVDNRREIACEAFFNDVFFGTRRIGTPIEIVTFTHGFTNIAAKASTGLELLKRIESDLKIPVGVKFKFAEIGAVDAWKSVGAFQIDDPMKALECWELFLSTVNSSAVGRDSSHKKAIEFSFDNYDGTTHWFALPVSTGTKLASEQLRSALERFCYL